MMTRLRAGVCNHKGFSLMELIVVIAIIGILAAFLIPNLTGFTDDADDAKLKADADTLKTAIETYRAKNSSRKYPPDSNLVETLKRYLPADWAMPQGISYTQLNAGADYALRVTLKNPENTGYIWDAKLGKEVPGK